jgi:hypothetical protein
VGARGAKDEVDLLPKASRAEQEDHDERVREAHLCSVDGAIARALDDGEEVLVRRVEDDAFQGFLLFAEMSIYGSFSSSTCDIAS